MTVDRITLPLLLVLIGVASLASYGMASELPRGGVHMDVLDASRSDAAIEHRQVTRRHAFRAEAGERWEFILASEAFDAYLYLLDANDNVVTFDDDGAGNLDSRIVWEAPSDGVWTLVATSFGGGSEGPYELRSSILRVTQPEPRALELGVWNTDVFGEGAGRNEDGVHTAVYTLQVETPVRLQLQVQQSDWSHGLRIVGPFFDEVSAELAGGWGVGLDGVRPIHLLWPGEYRLFVTTHLANPQSSLRFRVDVASAVTARASRPLPESGSVQELLAPGPRHEGDRWTTTIEAGTLVVAELRSTEFDAYLLLEDQQGVVIMEDDDSAGDLDSRIIFQPRTSGDWTFVATSFGDTESGNYELVVTRHAPPRRLEARRLRAGRTVSGNLAEPDFISADGWQGPGRAYRFEAEAGQRLMVDLEGEGLFFEIIDPTGVSRGNPTFHDAFFGYGLLPHGHMDAGRAEVTSENPAGLVDLTTGGEHMLFVRGPFDAGTYRLTISFVEPERAETLSWEGEEAVEGRFADSSPIEPWAGFYQTLRFELDSAHFVQISAEGESANVTLEVREVGGGFIPNQASEDPADRYLGHGSSRFAGNLLPGEYMVTLRQPDLVRTRWRAEISREDLRVPEMLSIALGETRRGQMDGALLRAPERGTPGVPWRVTLEAGELVDITMRSTDVDAYLVLVAEDGSIAAMDDDSGGNLDARIRFASRQGGEYVIYATTFGASTSGSYTLSVEPAAGP